MVLVRVDVQGVKSRLFVQANTRKNVYTITRSTFAHTNKNTDSVCHLLVKARIVFIPSKRLAHTKQCNANVDLFWPCTNVSVVHI